jgi:hypothetical protein
MIQRNAAVAHLAAYARHQAPDGFEAKGLIVRPFVEMERENETDFEIDHRSSVDVCFTGDGSARRACG